MTSSPSFSDRSRKHGVLGRLQSEAVFWILAAIFFCVGLLITVSAVKVLMSDWPWKNAVNTVGRVIITEWQHERNDNRLKITYRYRDQQNIIYHSTGVVARKLGKINLKPGSPIVVLFQKDSPAESRLAMELSSGEWVPLLVIGLLEMSAGCLFVLVGIRKLKGVNHSN